MFSRHNKDSIRPGDILQVRRRNGDPFSGVLLNIRRRGIDTGFLLRDQLTRVGVEMWFKLYSPAIEDIDLVQRKAKKARRAKLYYMRYARFVSFLAERDPNWSFYIIGSQDMTLARSQTLLRSTCVASGQGKGREGRYELCKCVYINTEIISSEVLRSPRSHISLLGVLLAN